MAKSSNSSPHLTLDRYSWLNQNNRISNISSKNVEKKNKRQVFCSNKGLKRNSTLLQEYTVVLKPKRHFQTVKKNKPIKKNA